MSERIFDPVEPMINNFKDQLTQPPWISDNAVISKDKMSSVSNFGKQRVHAKCPYIISSNAIRTQEHKEIW